MKRLQEKDFFLSPQTFSFVVFFNLQPQHTCVAYLCLVKQNVSGKSIPTLELFCNGLDSTYRHKNQNGVLTIYFSNTKLRDIIVGAITELQNQRLPT